MDKNNDPTLAGTQDQSLKLRKLRDRKSVLEELMAQTKDQIQLIEVDMMRCGVDIPSSEVKCCGHCQPSCPVHYDDGGCGCHKQCLREQCIDEDKPSKLQEKSLTEKIDDKLDEPLNEFVPERDWPHKL